MDYIVTDPVTWLQADIAIAEMGSKQYISALLLDGPPGCGKTYLAKYIAHQLKAELIQFQFFPGAGREELLLDPIAINGVRAKGILPISAEKSHDHPVVLLLDEIDKADRTVDAFLLNFLNEGGLYLPQLGDFQVNRKQYIVVITKNDQRDASSALLRRCRCARMRWPNKEVETIILQRAIPGIPEAACHALIDIASRPREDTRFTKAPATPEVVRLAEDVMNLVERDVPPQTLGRYVLVSMAPLGNDLDLLGKLNNDLYIGTLMRTHFGPFVQARKQAPLPANATPEPVPAATIA